MKCIKLVIMAGLLSATGALALSGCSQSASQVNEKALARVRIQQSAVFTRSAAVEGGEYRLQPGDRLSIRFPYQRELNQGVSVRPDGKITLEAAGEVEAAGLTTAELEMLLEERSSRIARDPEVFVNLEQFAENRVYVGGEVKEPGFVKLRTEMTPLQAILERGGFRDTAGLDNVLRLVRGPGGDFTAERIDLEAVVEDGEPETVRLNADDIVFVPKSGIAKMNLAVEQYFRNMFPVDTGATASARVVP